MKTRVLGALATAAFTGACATGINAGADYSPSVDFGSYSSFTWDEPDDRPIGDPRLENNPFFEDRLHQAITDQLVAVGIRPDASGRAVIVHHHATVRNRVEVYEVDAREGYTSPEYGRGPQVDQYDEGTILIDIADAETHELIWRGWAQFDITAALTEPEVMADALDRAAARMFENFPVAGRQ